MDVRVAPSIRASGPPLRGPELGLVQPYDLIRAQAKPFPQK